MKQIYKNNQKLSYNIKGNGKAVILIHGFMESSAIWDSFSDALSENYKVISVDLPGHGESALNDYPYSIEKYAEAVLQIVLEENLKQVFIIGHSMGGYVTLAFAEFYREYINGLCLFHSSPFADSEEKKIARMATIESIRTGNIKTIIQNHFKSVFFEKNLPLYADNIDKAVAIAEQMEEISVIASIEAMAARKDRLSIMQDIDLPVLFIAGKEDKLIPLDLSSKLQLKGQSKINILNHSGHMGMIEEKEKALEIIKQFLISLKFI